MLFLYCNIVYCQFVRKFGMIRLNEWYFFAPNKTFGAVSTTDGAYFCAKYAKIQSENGSRAYHSGVKRRTGQKKSGFSPLRNLLVCAECLVLCS